MNALAASLPQIQLCNVIEAVELEGSTGGRAALLIDGRLIDVERRSHGAFSSDVMSVLAHWDAFLTWAAAQRSSEDDPPVDPSCLGPCVPRPGQVFAIGLNYRDHAKESGLQEPAQPMVFTKFASCVAGAHATIALPSETVDWEIELVVVIGKTARRVSEAQALEHVAGYCVGQDISDRRLQFMSAPPQFSLAKSAPNFGPIGPALVARANLDTNNLSLLCDVNGARMQNGNTSNMIFPVPALIAYLSRHSTLLPGDIIFTGTPSGVGSGRTPRVYLKPGDLIRSEIPGLGVLETRCIADAHAHH